jgi:prepilin peptidase CpaA
MNLAQLAPVWLVAILSLLLLGAAADDGWRLRISNIFPIAIIAGAVAGALLAGPNLALWQNLLMFAALLAVGTFLFSAGMLGGGDVKLLAACGLWFNLSSGWKMLVAVAIAGGLLAILLISIRPLIGKPSATWILLRPRGGIPYGIAIAAGTATLVAMVR